MGIISYQIPVPGQAFATEAAKVDTALQTLLTLVNGTLDETNVAAEFAQSAGVNVGGVGAKGVVVNAGPGTRTNTTYGALNDAADQVTGIVLPTNGLIAVWFQATWQESVAGAARAAIFIGANQLKISGTPNSGGAAPVTQAARTNASVGFDNAVLCSHGGGLMSIGYNGTEASPLPDATTGQVVGYGGGSFAAAQELNTILATVATPAAGPCYIFAAAGTYTVGVQYKATSGTVTASGRKLWVKAESFA